MVIYHSYGIRWNFSNWNCHYSEDKFYSSHFDSYTKYEDYYLTITYFVFLTYFYYPVV